MKRRRSPKDGTTASVCRLSFILNSLTKGTISKDCTRTIFRRLHRKHSQKCSNFLDFMLQNAPQHWKWNILDVLLSTPVILKLKALEGFFSKAEKKMKQNREDWFFTENREDWFFIEVVNTKTTLLAGKRRPWGHSELVLNSDAEGRHRLKYN